MAVTNPTRADFDNHLVSEVRAKEGLTRAGEKLYRLGLEHMEVERTNCLIGSIYTVKQNDKRPVYFIGVFKKGFAKFRPN